METHEALGGIAARLTVVQAKLDACCGLKRTGKCLTILLIHTLKRIAHYEKMLDICQVWEDLF